MCKYIVIKLFICFNIFNIDAEKPFSGMFNKVYVCMYVCMYVNAKHLSAAVFRAHRIPA